MKSFQLKKHDQNIDAPPIQEANGVMWISSPSLDQLEWAINGTSTRIGGVSSGFTEAMNFCNNEFDTPENVSKNREIFFDAIGVDEANVVNSRQIHKTDIAVVDEAMLALSPDERSQRNGDIDGLTTDVPGTTLACYSADCCIVTIVDPVNRAVGIAHAGWRGTVEKIASKLLETMTTNYGTSPSDVVCSLGPSICKDCFEVGEDVVAAAKDAFDESTWPAIFTPHATGDGKYQFDIWEANAQALIEAGVPRQSIEKPNACTCCNPDIFFSHRASNGRRGTIMTFVGIK